MFSIPRVLLILLLSAMILGCGKDETSDSGAASPNPTSDGGEVVVYVALDEMYSRPILDAFEAETGIRVRPVYDTEASKTTGLVTRLISERNRPRADVFWNNETAQTIVLKNEGVLAPYQSMASFSVPERFKDPDHYWTGFAARARVIIYNTDQVKEPPTSILDLIRPEWKGRAAIALPLYGTTATHAAALFASWGPERSKQYLLDLLANDVAVLPGNATVRDLVAKGEFAVGLTDTDDANGAVEDGLPAQWLFPDQEEGGLGTLLIPNTVALIANAPHPAQGKALIDFLLSPGVEERLSKMRSIQIPLQGGVDPSDNTPDLDAIRAMEVDFGAAAEVMKDSAAFVTEHFVR